MVPFLGFASWFIAGPVFLATFVMSIMVMTRGGTLQGISLLLFSMIVAPLVVLFAPFVSSFVSSLVGLAGVGAVAPSHEQNQPSRATAPQNPARRDTPYPVINSRTPPPAQSSSTPTRGEPSVGQKIADAAANAIDLTKAGPLEIEVAKEQAFDTKVNSQAPAVFSRDGRRVLYLTGRHNYLTGQSSEPPLLIIRNLRTLAVEATIKPSLLPGIMSFSPDESRIAYIPLEGKVHIIEIKSGQDTALPVDIYLQQNSRFWWSAANEIHYYGSSGVLVAGNFTDRVINLETLEIKSTIIDFKERNSFEEKLDSALFNHSLCRFEASVLQQNGNHSYLFIKARSGPEVRPLLRDIFSYTPYFVSPDLRHLIVVKPEGEATLYTLGPASGNRPTWRIEIDNSKLLDAKRRAEHASYLQDKIPFWAKVYAPQLNPLNGKVVGPNLDAFKGSISIVQWHDTYAVGVTALEMQPFSEGDIVTAISSESWGKRGNWPFSYQNEWRVLRINDPVKPFSFFDDAFKPKLATTPVPTATQLPRPVMTPGPSLNVNKPMVYVQATPVQRPTPPDRAGIVRQFMEGHCSKMTRGDLQGYAGDCSDPVDYYTRGMVDRAEILRNAENALREYTRLTQTLRSIKITQLSATTFNAQCAIDNGSWKGNQRVGGGLSSTDFVVELRPGGPQIVKIRLLK